MKPTIIGKLFKFSYLVEDFDGDKIEVCEAYAALSYSQALGNLGFCCPEAEQIKFLGELEPKWESEIE